MPIKNNPYFEQAQKEQWRGDYAAALQYYRQAIQMDPNCGELYWEMAISLIHMGMKEEARAAQEKAAALDPAIKKRWEEIKAKPNKPADIKRLRGEGPAGLAGLLEYALDKEERISEMAFEALEDEEYRVDATNIPLLMETLKTTTDGRLQYKAAKLLGRVGPEAADPVFDLLAHPDDLSEMQVTQTLRALEDMHEPRALPVLLHWFKDTRLNPRAAAFDGLAKLRSPEAVEPLIEMLEAGMPWEEWDVFHNPARLLGELGDLRAFDPLVNLLSSPNTGAIGWAITALGQLGDPRAIAHIKPFLKHEDQYVPEHAAKALEKLKAKT
ncbi:MAG: HEAT repeat domain-containing protein [Chloroflexi bacterium]|nr:HEAT repeat domain-containing protein [Chloroflexota bacterium]